MCSAFPVTLMSRESKTFPFSNDLIREFCSVNQSFDQEEDSPFLSPHYQEAKRSESRAKTVSPVKRESNQTPQVRKTAGKTLAGNNRVVLSVWITTSDVSASQSRFKAAFAARPSETPGAGLLEWAQRYFPKRRSGRPGKLRKVMLSGKELPVAGLGRRPGLLSSTVSKSRLPKAAFQPFHFPQSLRPGSRSNDVSPRRT